MIVVIQFPGPAGATIRKDGLPSVDAARSYAAGYLKAGPLPVGVRVAIDGIVYMVDTARRTLRPDTGKGRTL